MTRASNLFVSLVAIGGLALAQAPAATPGAGPGRGRGPIAPVITGPSAPVPPEVAIQRPTPAEVTQINDAMATWISSDQSAAKPLLVRFQPQLMFQAPRLNVAATFTQTQQRMGDRHLGFVETASKGNIDLLFHGDSITDWWVQGDANKAMFDKYFGNMRTANFAIAGDTTQG